MKILVIGDWSWSQYEEAFSNALKGLDVEIEKFPTAIYFKGLKGNLEKKFSLPGLSTLKLNNDIVKLGQESKPDWIFFWRPTNILPGTLKQLSSMGILLVSYNNDDPFNCEKSANVPWFHRFMWYWYKKCLPFFDLNFFYREINCKEAIELGARNGFVMLPYFQPDQDHPIKLSAEEGHKYSTEVVFVGHYEQDGREKSIQVLLNAGIKVKLWGGKYWSKKVLGASYKYLAPIIPAQGEEYTKALNGADICLAFLSKLNRDKYTRRCFEIPACSKLLLVERTAELMMMFDEDEEACFFSSNDELVVKCKWLLENPSIRNRIAEKGFQRVWTDGHDINSRASEFISRLKSHESKFSSSSFKN